MDNKKIFILLPDGIGLRNFAYSGFYGTGSQQGFDIVYWNNTPFPLADLGFNEIRIENARNHPLGKIYKNARKHIELNLNMRRTNDPIYKVYRLKMRYGKVRQAMKSLLTEGLIALYSSEKGLQKVRRKIHEKEKQTEYYQRCRETLRKEKPALVFCTNQRPTLAIAPLLAAQELGIPTATFIFSWDNLPKATMVVETDYYFVWSELMKAQLLEYYPYINKGQIIVAGTPQFESHYDASLLLPKAEFFRQHGLDETKRYICFSGDDITTSPDDPAYLEDVALAVEKLNNEGHQLGIIFRRCPVDFSGRYEAVVARHKNIIVEIAPQWKSLHTNWDSILPTPEDIALQANTIHHTELVINLGSSMVFDYAAFGKPCIYLNYNQQEQAVPSWDIRKCYDYVHFRSMPGKEAVGWLNSAEEIETVLIRMLGDRTATIASARKWFETVALHPPQSASERIWRGITEILNQATWQKN